MIQPKSWFDSLGEWLTKVLEAAIKLLMILIVIAAYGILFWFGLIVFREAMVYFQNL